MIVDARGHRCPVPTLRLAKALDTAPPGVSMTLLATDPMARIDAPHLAQQRGARVVSIVERDGVISIEIETPDGVPKG